MLKRLMVELVAEEAQHAEKIVDQKVSEANAAREAAKQERERKKQLAIERSKQRQGNPDYFKQRVEANANVSSTRKDSKSDGAKIDDVCEVQPDDNGNNEVAESRGNGDLDPFRSYSGGRSKIYIKWYWRCTFYSVDPSAYQGSCYFLFIILCSKYLE